MAWFIDINNPGHINMQMFSDAEDIELFSVALVIFDLAYITDDVGNRLLDESGNLLTAG